MVHMRFDPNGVESTYIAKGKISARAYIALENEIIKAMQSLIDGRQTEIIVSPPGDNNPFDEIKYAPKRVMNAINRGALEFPVKDRTVIRAIRDLLRGWYWAFISIDDRIGVSIAGRGTMYFSGLSADEAKTLGEKGLNLEQVPHLVPDESLWVQTYS